MTWQLAVNSRKISPNRFAAVTSTNPARVFGLYPKKGIIAVGSDADIVIWDPALERTITSEKQHMNTDYNPFEGMAVRGWPVTVILRGRPIVVEGRWLGGEGRGRFIPRTQGEFL